MHRQVVAEFVEQSVVEAEGDFDFVDDAIDIVRVGAKRVEAGSIGVLIGLGPYRKL